jgi:hypothetical protein
MFSALTADLMDLQSYSTGSSQTYFAPTAARCSSSSSTCCTGCVSVF